MNVAAPSNRSEDPVCGFCLWILAVTLLLQENCSTRTWIRRTAGWDFEVGWRERGRERKREREREGERGGERERVFPAFISQQRHC